MTRYRLAIFDFDGTLADSMPWFRASFQDMITRFDLAPVRDDEVEGLRGLSAREIMARLNVSMWQLPAIVSDMRKRKLAAAGEISLFAGIPAMLSRPASATASRLRSSVPTAKPRSGRCSDPRPA